jgi:hypothetical protein
MPLDIDCKRMIGRYALSVLLGNTAVVVLKNCFGRSFDSVAAIGLYSCIIAVAGEDVSLGPVVHKAINRSIGVLLGGFLGYVLLFFPIVLFPNHKGSCLLILPTLFVAFTQWSTKGGWEKVSSIVKSSKASHMIIQMQVAFGVVYIGAWDAIEAEIDVAILRTIAIVLGCIILIFSTFSVYPQTSMRTATTEVIGSLKASSELASVICSDCRSGIVLPPFDHISKIFLEKSSDKHIKLLDTIDMKISRGIFHH